MLICASCDFACTTASMIASYDEVKSFTASSCSPLNKWPFVLINYAPVLIIDDCKGKLTNAWGLGGLLKAHSKLL